MYIKSHKLKCLTGEVIMWCQVETEQMKWPCRESFSHHSTPVGCCHTRIHALCCQVSLLFKKTKKQNPHASSIMKSLNFFIKNKKLCGPNKTCPHMFCEGRVICSFAILSLYHQMNPTCKFATSDLYITVLCS